jgi:uncharacterized protein (TIGR02646 family)
MIPLTLGAEPPILIENGAAWGEEFATAVEAGIRPLPARYRRDDVKDALRHETKGKCAYCESHIEHISYSHIEHILPKSIRPLLVCIWQNLTLACERCNKNKGDYFSEEAPLLNPYADDVENEVCFHGPMAIDRSDTAKLTIAKLKLNRPELIFRREERLREILRILDLIVAAQGNEAIVASLIEDLTDKLLATSEYTSCVRHFTEVEAPQRGVELP